MICLVYTTGNATSASMGEHLLSSFDFREISGSDFRHGNLLLRRIDSELVHYESIGSEFELVCFLSVHSSAEGVGALTVHSLGNWGMENRLGGRPRSLSVASPLAMLSVLSGLNCISSDLEKTYEATHHGPLLEVPSFFTELGGNEKTMKDKVIAGRVAEAVYTSLAEKGKSAHCQKVAIGIGGTHYPSKFTNLALTKGYAFGHIMPRHAILNSDGSDNIAMLEQAVSRSSERPETAVIEWKSINSGIRSRVIKELDRIGIDYERV